MSRWREDFEMENGGFPVFGIYNALDESSSVLSVVAYPNPGRNVLNIHTALPNACVEIYDITGKLICNQKVTENITSINAESWPSGVYIWKVYTSTSIGSTTLAETGKWIRK